MYYHVPFNSVDLKVALCLSYKHSIPQQLPVLSRQCADAVSRE